MTVTFRDEHGRVVTLGHLLGFALAGLVLGIVVLLLVDGVVAALSGARFGRASGWLAVILPTWLMVEDFRAWRGTGGRVLVALVGAAVGIALGLLAAGLLGDLPPLVTGAVGATVAVLAYAVIWFHGVRRFAR